MIKTLLTKIDPDGKFFNTGFYNYFLIALTIVVLYFGLLYGGVTIGAILGVAGGSFVNLAMFLVVYYGLLFFKLGVGRDINKEIYDEHNVAAGVYEGLLALAIATIIAKGLL